jgi:voltage-gated potassium channel
MAVSARASELLANRPLLRRTLLPVASLVSAVVLSIAGYVVLADIGVIEAAYWLISPTEVGIYFTRNPGPESTAKAFAVLTQAGLVVISLWLGQTVVSALFGGQITEELKRVQQERTITKLSNHVVICGYGMFGETIAERLAGAQQEVVVVERDEQEVIRAERADHLVVDGDARQEATLERANIADAETIVAAVDNSNVNIQVGILANQMAPSAKLVVRVGDRMYDSMARRAGADVVVIPEVLSGDEVADGLTADLNSRHG